MSMFENNRYHWRETYFVLFRQSGRPTMQQLEAAIEKLGSRYELRNQHADDDGMVESLTVVAHDDYSAIDVCYVEGDEVVEQIEGLVQELKPELTGEDGKAVLAQLARCDARFDVLHFEEKSILDEEDEDEDEDSLDPSALLLILDRLAKLTGGIAYDPQSGVIVEEE